MPDLIRNTTPIARKAYPCDASHWLQDRMESGMFSYAELRSIAKAKRNNWTIQPGEQYIKQVQVWDDGIVVFRAIPEIDEIFNAASTKQLKIDLWEIGHFDLPILQWAAVKEGHCTKDQWIAYKLTGFKYEDGGPILIFDIKAFDQDAGIEEMDEPLYAYLPLNWEVTEI